MNWMCFFFPRIRQIWNEMKMTITPIELMVIFLDCFENKSYYMADSIAIKLSFKVRLVSA